MDDELDVGKPSTSCSTHPLFVLKGEMISKYPEMDKRCYQPLSMALISPFCWREGPSCTGAEASRQLQATRQAKYNKGAAVPVYTACNDLIHGRFCNLANKVRHIMQCRGVVPRERLNSLLLVATLSVQSAACNSSHLNYAEHRTL